MGTLAQVVQNMAVLFAGILPASLGQKTKAASLAVTLASDEDSLEVLDAGPAWTSVFQTTTSADMTVPAFLTAAPTAGQKLVIDDIVFSGDTAMYVDFFEETSLTRIMRLYIAAGGTAQSTTRGKMQLPTADKRVIGQASLAGNIAITVLYHSEA